MRVKINDIDDFATKKQLDLIKEIENELGVLFRGRTKRDASKFISKYLNEAIHSREPILSWGEIQGY